MRFQRMKRYEQVTWTERKLQAFMQRDQRQRRKVDRSYPLLGAALLVPPAPPPDAEAELASRRAASASSEKTMRDLAAKHWRKGRAQFYACDPSTRAAIRSAWAAWTGPLSALMFIYIVEKHNGEAERRRRRVQESDAVILQKIHSVTATQGQLDL